jgi:hypothetical protein
VDRGVPLALVIGLLALHALFLFRHAVDSDEAQHLHVIYEWLRGAVPYRDVFDNHTPFFHWLFLPFAWLVGETPDVVLLARLAQIPISFGLLGLLYVLAVRLYDRAVALWTVALALALADWSLKTLEFRPDVLWTLCWFGSLIVLLHTPGWRTFFLAGFLLGTAAMISVKTSFLLAGLGLGWAGAWILSADFRSRYPIGRIAKCGLSGAIGFAIVPSLFLAWFASHHALEAMRYCLFTVNQPESPQVWRVLLACGGMLLAVAVGWTMRCCAGGNRTAVFLTAAFYALLVIGFSPTLKKQTFLPAYPLLILTAVGELRFRRPRRVPWLEGAACAVLLAHQVVEGAPWEDGLADQRELLNDTLALSKTGETLLDLKGETIFRPRPIYLAYVLATTRGMASGRLAKERPEALSMAGTAVVISNGAGLPPEMRKFLKDSYVPAGRGRLRVAGSVLERRAQLGPRVASVNAPAAGDYLLLAGGSIPVRTVSITDPGRQTLEIPDDRPFLLYWKPAWLAGYRPQLQSIPALREPSGKIARSVP